MAGTVCCHRGQRYVLIELHYLRQKRDLPVAIWNLWFPSARREGWQFPRFEFVAQRSFCLFVDSLQK
jgi:hypothetical protein